MWRTYEIKEILITVFEGTGERQTITENKGYYLVTHEKRDVKLVQKPGFI